MVPLTGSYQESLHAANFRLTRCVKWLLLQFESAPFLIHVRVALFLRFDRCVSLVGEPERSTNDNNTVCYRAAPREAARGNRRRNKRRHTTTQLGPVSCGGPLSSRPDPLSRLCDASVTPPLSAVEELSAFCSAPRCSSSISI